MELTTEVAEPLKITEENKIYPIIGSHLINESVLYQDYYDEFLKGFNPKVDSDFSVWDRDTVREVRKCSPRMILIDGMRFDPLFYKPPYNWDVYHRLYFPGDPYTVREDRKSYCIVEGDLPISTLIEFKNSKNALSSASSPADLMHQSLITFMEIPADWDIERMGALTTRTNADPQNFAALYVNEFLGSFGLMLVGGWLLLKDASKQTPRRSFLKSLLKAGGLIAGGSNAGRLLSSLPSLVKDVPVGEQMYKPFELPLSSLYFFNPEALLARKNTLSFRDAMVAIKLREADKLVPDDSKSTGPLTTVFGTAHALDYNLWNDPAEQRRQLENNLEEIFKISLNLAQKHNINLNPAFKKAARDRLSEFLGGTLVWEVKQPDDGEAFSRRDLILAKSRKTITPRASFISQTITDLVSEAARKTNF